MDVNGNAGSPINIAWLAGLLEGEGSFVFNRKAGGRCDVRIQLNMTDQDIIERAAKMLGRSVYRAQRGGDKPQWYVRTTGIKSISWIMTIYGLMGARRQKKIRELLAYWKAQPIPYNKRGTCPQGHPYDREYKSTNGRRIRRHRICLRCTRANNRKRYLLHRRSTKASTSSPALDCS